MKRFFNHLTLSMILGCLMLVCAIPAYAENMTAGDTALTLIEHYEGFSVMPYSLNGRWYIGYGSQITEGSYSGGISEEEAEALLRGSLQKIESSLNSFLERNNLSLTQQQFDALVDFTYTYNDTWLNGSSDLLRIVKGELDADRRETARAFGVWSHSGGVVLPSLAERRMKEAAIYLDGSIDGAEDFCYLAVNVGDGVSYATDFAVYERGSVYDYFPVMFRLGFSLGGLESSKGTTLHLGDTVLSSMFATPVWERNRYNSTSYSDVKGDQWYYDYVMELSETGVIGGRGDGLYAPGDPTSVGEALKLVLLAAGHPEQPGTESHWAGGYAEYARDNQMLNSVLLSDLNQPITRRDVAQLAACAMGFGQSFRSTPFDDTNDGFVTALAEAGILNGVTEGERVLFYPGKTLTRAEVSAIIWRVRSAVSLKKTQTLTYSSRTFSIAPGVSLSKYLADGFFGSGITKTYHEPGVTVLRGVDVSRYQGDIQWETVKTQGIDFAILRVGGRFQQSGTIYDDARFEEYYAGASAAGLRIGAYFFSQAITPDEAVREADYVISKLEGKHVDGPVVFDWETAGSSNARTNNLPVSVVCDCAIAYCEQLKAAGYTPMIYMNTYDGYIKYDLSRLTDYDIWYAGQYGGPYPTFVYDYQMWQYTDKGEVEGLEGKTDMDLWFFREA